MRRTSPPAATHVQHTRARCGAAGNLTAVGAADFYPKTSGKCEAARYLLRRFEAQAADAAFLCDDDNDMELAAIVGKAFLPSVTSVRHLGAVTQGRAASCRAMMAHGPGGDEVAVNPCARRRSRCARRCRPGPSSLCRPRGPGQRPRRRCWKPCSAGMACLPLMREQAVAAV